MSVEILCLCIFHPSKTILWSNSLKSLTATMANFSTMQYYLKARFHFNKNEFADLMLIAGVVATISQVYMLGINIVVGTFLMLFDSLIFFCFPYFHFVFWISNNLDSVYMLILICFWILQLFLMPLLVSPLGDGRLLSIGLLVTCVNVRVLFSP